MERTDLGWCLQSYSILSARKNLSLTCSNKLIRDAINIVHSAQLAELNAKAYHFIVCVQADFPARPWSHYHLVQNKTQLRRNTFFLPLWIQPGLIQRDNSRNSVQTVAYTGIVYNGNMAATEKLWKEYFLPYGIEFNTLVTGAWNDLHNVDVLIGIRSFDSKTYNRKPVSKLLNAWHAQIPFIGGYDSAYRQIGIPGQDYLIAKTMKEAVAAVLRLRDDKELYAKLVANGRNRAMDFTNERIAEQWEQALKGPVYKRYENWKKRTLYELIMFNLLRALPLIKKQTKLLTRSVQKVYLRQRPLPSHP
jgi:hypothetical protein